MASPLTADESTSHQAAASHQQEIPTRVPPIPGWKRVIDLSVILLLLPLLVVLATFTYIWIRVLSPGNVLFRQTRIGRGGEPFTIYKFRSMKFQTATEVHESHVEHLVRSNRPMTKLDVFGDARLIKGGYLIRQSGLDEIPQLINVLRGEMSLVGPRPCLPSEFKLYGEDQRRRFTVLPGLTGNWQVKRTDSTTFSQMVKMDDEYVSRMSMAEDIQIAFKTPFILLSQMKRNSAMRRRLKKANNSRTASAVPRSAFGLSMSSTQKFSD